jgi:hypothetical protein
VYTAVVMSLSRAHIATIDEVRLDQTDHTARSDVEVAAAHAAGRASVPDRSADRLMGFGRFGGLVGGQGARQRSLHFKFKSLSSQGKLGRFRSN